MKSYKKPIEMHDELNPKIWDNDSLNPEVRRTLIKIAKDFKKFVDIPFRVVDLQLSGGNANYSYTEHSDIDLHLIVDYSSVACDRAAHELFDTKRLLYREQYDINIKGIPVEVYVEDSNEPAVSSNYSISKNQWIKHPEKKNVKIDEQKVMRMVELWKNLIYQATRLTDRLLIQKVLKLLRTYRKHGLATDGEFSTPNLVYKSLRNSDTIKNLMDVLNDLHDQELSLK
jgi:hypothetical protein